MVAGSIMAKIAQTLYGHTRDPDVEELSAVEKGIAYAVSVFV